MQSSLARSLLKYPNPNPKSKSQAQRAHPQSTPPPSSPSSTTRVYYSNDPKSLLAYQTLYPLLFPASSISFKKTSFQCQTLAWCSEIDSTTPTERHPYAFCTYEEVLVADGSDEEGKVPSIPEVAKAITTPSDSSQFKPFKLPAIGQFVDGSKEIRDPTLPVLKEISSLLGVDPSAPGLPGNYNPPIDLL
ncbi:hypothetical protein N0V85_007173, partial [Neurospora sp. IMI 360204]